MTLEFLRAIWYEGFIRYCNRLDVENRFTFDGLTDHQIGRLEVAKRYLFLQHGTESR